MWAGADTARSALRRYLRAKARLLGREPLDWWDLAAPVGDRDARALTWEEAQGRILSAFEAADPGLAEAARRLLAEGAVEVEARPHKRAGAVCCPFGARRTSRIFATFTGTLQSAAMVAHELGHGWHADVLYSVPMVRRWITAPFAETASMFAEDAFRSGAGGRALAGLDQQLQGSVAVLLDNRARFEFERACYRLRREGPLSAPVLGEVMASCQRQVFGDALRSWDPLLWAKKGHFFTARTAFNNWSYAFGYLFGLAIRRLDAPTRRELLLRTGWQGARALAHDMLGVDLGDATFWAEAARPVVAAAEEFEQMAGVEVPVDSVSRVSE
jgi:oligoendopeptidase F